MESKKESKTNKKELIISIVIASIVTIVLLVVIGVMRYEFAYRGTDKKALEFIADITSTAGFIGLLFWMIAYVSSKGAFDIIIYGTKKMVFAIFRKNPRSGLPRTYAEYVEIQREKDKAIHLPFLIITGGVFLLGIILLIIHYSLK